MKTVLTVLGILALVMGLLWAGQGMGIIRWPAGSFMIDAAQWTFRGGALALGGAILIWLGRRR
jgi:hypothetical protein